MKIRQITAALALSAMAVVATAGVAAAQDTSSTTAPAKGKAALCAKATARLPKIQDRETKVEARITKLQARLTTAQQNNHPDAVKVIQSRIDWLQQVDQHLKDATNLINSECATS